MEPISILTAATAVVGGIQAISQGFAQAATASANADLLRDQATTTANLTAAQEAEVRRRGRRVLGEQRAAIAESGTGFGGANADLMRQSATDLEMDALNVRYQGYLQRRGLTNQAKMTEWQGRQAKRSALIGGGLSILGGTGLYLGSNSGSLFGGGGGPSLSSPSWQTARRVAGVG